MQPCRLVTVVTTSLFVLPPLRQSRLLLFCGSTIAMMHGDLTAANNLLQEHKPAFFIYLVAQICHKIAKEAPRSNTLITILFHGSGVIAFEALLWLIVAGQFLGFFIINVLISLLTLLCYYDSIYALVTMCYGHGTAS